MGNNLNAYPFGGEDNRVYGRVIEASELPGSSQMEVHITLINEKMIEEDRILLGLNEEAEDVIKKYKPYFYEFVTFVEYRKEIVNYYQEGNWYAMNLYSSEIVDEALGVIIQGEIIFSASPIQRRGMGLVITDVRVPTKILKDIKEIYTLNDTSIKYDEKDKLRNVIESVLPPQINDAKVLIYNVGQANNTYISLNRNYGLFYDVGYTLKGYETHSMKKSIKKYSLKYPRLVILSHWDLDHVLGVVYANESIYKAVWIMPDLGGIPENRRSISACRLYKYLQWSKPNGVFSIHESFNNRVIYNKGNEIKLIKAKGGRGCYTNNENNFGIIMEINVNKRMILTGDVEYEKLPDGVIGEEYDYLVIPHHGGDVGEPKIKGNIAFISVGENKYGHPNKQRYREIEDMVDIVYTTKQHGGFEICLWADGEVSKIG